MTGGLRISPVPNQTAAHRRKSGVQLVRTASGRTESPFPRFVPAGRNHHIPRPKIDRNTELPVQINRTGYITTDHGKIPVIRSRNRIHRALNAICAEPLCRILKHRKLSHTRFQREFSQRETFDLFPLDRLRRIPAVFRPNAQLQRDLLFFSCIIHCGQTDCAVCPSLFSDKIVLFRKRSNLHRGARDPVCNFPSAHLHVVQPEGCAFFLGSMAGLQSDDIPGAFSFPGSPEGQGVTFPRSADGKFFLFRIPSVVDRRGKNRQRNRIIFPFRLHPYGECILRIRSELKFRSHQQHRFRKTVGDAEGEFSCHPFLGIGKGSFIDQSGVRIRPQVFDTLKSGVPEFKAAVENQVFRGKESREKEKEKKAGPCLFSHGVSPYYF